MSAGLNDILELYERLKKYCVYHKRHLTLLESLTREVPDGLDSEELLEKLEDLNREKTRLETEIETERQACEALKNKMKTPGEMDLLREQSEALAHRIESHASSSSDLQNKRDEIEYIKDMIDYYVKLKREAENLTAVERHMAGIQFLSDKADYLDTTAEHYKELTQCLNEAEQLFE